MRKGCPTSTARQKSFTLGVELRAAAPLRAGLDLFRTVARAWLIGADTLKRRPSGIVLSSIGRGLGLADAVIAYENQLLRAEIERTRRTLITAPQTVIG